MSIANFKRYAMRNIKLKPVTQQTAVEWLKDKLKETYDKEGKLPLAYTLHLVEQAKQMEKEQMKSIELPSDEEMDKFLLDNSYEYGYGYRDAIDWIKKQILNQNK